MKATLIFLSALAALCHAAAVLQGTDIHERDGVFVRQVTIIVTQTTTRTSIVPVYTTSTKYTTLPTHVVTKTQTVTKPYTPLESTSTVVVTFTAKPTTVTPPVVIVTVTAHTSTSAKPIVTVTVTYVPPEGTEESGYPEDPETQNNSWQITRTAPVLTFRKRAPSPAPEANPQRGQGRPTRGGGWGPGGQTIVETETIKQTVTYYPPISTGNTRTITVTPDVPDKPSTSTFYFTPTPISTKAPVIVTSTVTITPTITAAPSSITKTITPSPTAKSTVRSTVTIWDRAIPKRAPQSFGVPTRTNGGIIPSETFTPEDPEEEYPYYPADEPTYVLGSPSRTVNVTPTPVKPVPTSTKKATTTKKPWWNQEPVTVTITKYTPSPTGTLIRNTGALPVLTLRLEGKSATFAPGAPVRSSGVFVTLTVPAQQG
ncbi:uncharacterized protein RSE6_13100 [Rhynchosporium secalis]|uniref:Uncharacterized protein n=1 Tax=Rhynchosporium secalis TaxID=38038 RepID=A0A1E1MSV9_RHYSE|nr:uncharacterized protein RSE6_13100 [Rhynchosporium secalis]